MVKTLASYSRCWKDTLSEIVKVEGRIKLLLVEAATFIFLGKYILYLGLMKPFLKFIGRCVYVSVDYFLRGGV